MAKGAKFRNLRRISGIKKGLKHEYKNIPAKISMAIEDEDGKPKKVMVDSSNPRQRLVLNTTKSGYQSIKKTFRNPDEFKKAFGCGPREYERQHHENKQEKL